MTVVHVARIAGIVPRQDTIAATADEQAEGDVDESVRLGECLPPDHLARFVVDVVAQLDFTAI